MRLKRIMSGFLAGMVCLMSAFPLCAFGSESAVDGSAAGGVGDETQNEVHAPYLTGFEDATVRPQQQVTRAQAAKMIYMVSGVKSSDIEEHHAFSDVSKDAWYGEAVYALTKEGILKGYSDGTFRPDQKITRAEFASVLQAYNKKASSSMTQNKDLSGDNSSSQRDGAAASGSFAGFKDVSTDSWYYDSVMDAAKNGWITGYAGNLFKPSANTTRAEAVTMMNRLLGRSADRITITTSFDIRVMPDVESSHWAYYQLLEAMTSHTCSKNENGEHWLSHEPGTVALSQGWHNIGGELFHVNASGCFDYKTTVDQLQLDADGRYTTGDDELDHLLTAAVKKAVRDEMSQEQKLRAVYDYAKQNFSYRGAENYETGSTGWETEAAKKMLSSGKGNCYSWAGAFTYLARKVGYPASAIAGESISEKGNKSIHAWTEILFDGEAYTFDPQIESVYAKNYGIKYDLFCKAYGTTPIQYVRPEIQEPGGDEVILPPDEKLEKIRGMVYEGLDAPGVMPVSLTKQNETYYLGVAGLDYRAGVGSDAMIIAIPHSVVLIEMREGADIEEAKRLIKENADGRKWICVGVADEDIRVASVGNYILLVMSEDSEQYIDNFMKNADKIAALN